MTTHAPPPDATALQAYWMPFTANRQFKAHPRMLASAQAMHYTTVDGRRLLDGIAGLWCVNAGHGHPKIVAAIQEQAATLGYATAFQMGHPKAFALAERLVALLPSDQFGHVFFTNSGSESVDTALKIALAYHRARGHGTRTRLIGRERGYHGVGFGGLSVGGMVKNRVQFAGGMLPSVDHLPHTHSLEHMAFSRGQPAWGAHLADDLERLVQLHDASTIAAVIVEPMAGSTGVLIPPKGYLERLRKICDRHGILLIFDEVISAFGRLGAAFGAHVFGAMPDIITCAKGLTNGAIPGGAVIARKDVYEAFMQGPENAVELFHGYTYSGHPMAMAAGLASLDVYAQEGLFARARDMSQTWEDAVHSLRGLPHVCDLRNFGLVAGIELTARPGAPGARAFEVFTRCYDKGVLVRAAGDTVVLSPSLIIEPRHIDEIFTTLRTVLQAVD